MYNASMPDSQALPSTGQLVRSTLLALVTALVLLVTVVMPAEYGIDPTGVGRLLGLTEMGEIKEQLAHEGEADAQAAQAKQPVTYSAVSTASEQQATELKVETPAAAEPVATAAAAIPVITAANAAQAEPATASNSQEISFKLVPGQGAEVKLEMKESSSVRFEWSANGGKLNFDTHGDPYNPPKGYYHGYGKGRFQPGDKGILTAAFDGNHGWFWRNRTKQDVTLTLKVKGDYIQLQRVL